MYESKDARVKEINVCIHKDRMEFGYKTGDSDTILDRVRIHGYDPRLSSDTWIELG